MVKHMSAGEAALAVIDRLRSELAAAREHEIEIMNEMRAVWVAAHSAGVPIAEIIRRSGVARQTVYDALPTSR